MFLRAMSSTNLYPVCLGMVKIWTLLYCSSNPLFSTMSQSVKGLCGQGADELHAGYPRYKDLSSHRLSINSRLDACEHPFANRLREGGIVGNGWSGDHNPSTVFSNLNSALDYEMNHGQLIKFPVGGWSIDTAWPTDLKFGFLSSGRHMWVHHRIFHLIGNYRLKWKRQPCELQQI